MIRFFKICDLACEGSEMIRILMILICTLFAVPAFSYNEEAKEEFFLSTPEQIATLSSEPSYLIGGLISPLSGQLTLKITDLVAKGAQNITLSRIYIAPQIPCHFSKEKHNQVAKKSCSQIQGA